MHGHDAAQFLWIGGAMLASAIFGAIAKRYKLPRVLGALIAGLFIGVAFGWTEIVHAIREGHAEFIRLTAELAAMLLLFKAGLESNLNAIIEDAKSGWKVAVLGVIVPIAGGFLYTFYAVGVPWQVALFQGGVFAATSVGITAAVLGELGVLSKPYAKIIISAAVIDDVIGLIVLTICTALNAGGEVDTTAIGIQIAGALMFVVIIPVLGHFFASKILRTLNNFDTKAREAIVMGWMMLYGAAAMYAGLAAIVGAYFAGVALDELYFEPADETQHDHEVEHHVDAVIVWIGPVFFVFAGCVVDPKVFLDPSVLMHGLAFTLIAMVGKMACALAIKEYKLIVGLGMSPRGEVGIIFATIGLQAGVLSTQLFGASMIMVLLTTFATPILLPMLIAKAE